MGKNKDCTDCMNCIPIGEGDHICSEDPTKLVLDEYIPTEEFVWCDGEAWEER